MLVSGACRSTIFLLRFWWLYQPYFASWMKKVRIDPKKIPAAAMVARQLFISSLWVERMFRIAGKTCLNIFFPEH